MKSFGVYAKDVIRQGEILPEYTSNFKLCVIELEFYEYGEGRLITDRQWLTRGDVLMFYNYELCIDSPPLPHQAILYMYRITHKISPFNINVFNQKLRVHCPIFLFYKWETNSIPKVEESKYGELDMNVDWDNITDWKQIPF